MHRNLDMQRIRGGFGIGAFLACSLILTACQQPRTVRTPTMQAAVTEEERRQQAFVFSENLRASSRIQNVAWKVLSNGIAICGDRTAYRPGGVVTSLEAWSPQSHSIVREAFPFIDDKVRVTWTYPDAPLARSNIREGDAIIAWNGTPVGTGKKGLANLQNQFSKHQGGPVTLLVERDGNQSDVPIELQRVCASDVNYVSNSQVNAFANGKQIVITSGMEQFARDETELALVISHELAHNLMGHLDAKKQNAVGGAAGGLLLDILAAVAGVNTQGQFMKSGMNAGASAYSQDFESEADYVGMYFLAAAGYPLENASNFWRRMAALNPRAISHATSHPTTAQRFVDINTAVGEIQQKQAAGEALMPNIKEAPPPKEDAPERNRRR